MRILMPLVLLLVLQACSGSTVPALPETLQIPCDHPVLLPERGLSQAEVEKYWVKDRIALASCRMRLDAVISVMNP